MTGRSPLNHLALGAGSPLHAHAKRSECPHCTRAQTPNDRSLAPAIEIEIFR